MDAFKKYREVRGVFGCATCRRAWLIKSIGSDVNSALYNISKDSKKAHKAGKLVCDGVIQLVEIEDVGSDWSYFNEEGTLLTYEDFFDIALEWEP